MVVDIQSHNASKETSDLWRYLLSEKIEYLNHNAVA